jgi:excisionase family DNA binding protein
MTKTTLRPPGAGALVRVPEAARRLGISLNTMRAMIEAGALVPVELYPGAHARLRWDDVEAVARGERVTP